MAAGGLVAFALSRRCCYYWRSLGDSKPCFLNKVSPLLTDRCLLFVYYPRWRQRNIFVDCCPYRAGENNHNYCVVPLEITALGQSRLVSPLAAGLLLGSLLLIALWQAPELLV